MSQTNPQGRKVLFAASLVSMVLGSIHAFSVFLTPLEATFGASRASVSLIYAFGLVFLTSAVLFGPSLYARFRPATLYVWIAVIGATGAMLAGMASSLAGVWIGYSLLFGVANGVGYGFGLQYAARANPDCAGLAMGVVTAAYALGAVLAPYGFKVALVFGGFGLAMTCLGLAVFAVSVAAAILVAQSGVPYANGPGQTRATRLPMRRIALIWLAYGSGVAAGLMAIGHAAGIAEAAGFAGWVAAAAIAGCNLVGSLLSGWASDRVSHQRLLTILPLTGAAALIALSMFPGQAVALLGVVGFAYGGTIATYPMAIAIQFPGDDGPRAYGRIFTAWGAAGLFAPWVAGQIYDWGGSYAPALWIAAALGILSALTAQKAIQPGLTEHP